MGGKKGKQGDLLKMMGLVASGVEITEAAISAGFAGLDEFTRFAGSVKGQRAIRQAAAAALAVSRLVLIGAAEDAARTLAALVNADAEKPDKGACGQVLELVADMVGGEVEDSGPDTVAGRLEEATGGN